MDPRGVAAYLISVARQAHARADAVERAGSLQELAQLQAQHDRQLAAMAALLAAWIVPGEPVQAEAVPPLGVRLRLALRLLLGR